MILGIIDDEKKNCKMGCNRKILKAYTSAPYSQINTNNNMANLKQAHDSVSCSHQCWHTTNKR